MTFKSYINCLVSWWHEIIQNYEIKETTDTASSALFLDLYLEFDLHSHLSTRIYDKRDDFNFEIINFPHLLLYQLHLHMGYIFPNLFDIQELAAPTQTL